MTAFIDKLKELFSKNFVVSGLLPTLVFIALNTLLLFATSERFRDFVARQQPNGSVAAVLQGGAVLFCVAVLASLISPSLTFFREILEGKHWLPVFAVIRTDMVKHETEMKNAWKRRIRELQHDDQQFQKALWTDELKVAVDVGKQAGAASYTRPLLPALDGAITESHKDRVIAFDSIKKAKDEVAGQLKLADKDEFDELRKVHTDFLNLLDYATARLDAEIVEYVNQQQRRWGPASIAPTELGNRAFATAAYGLKRYGFSMEIGWSRLQKVMLQKDSGHHQILQDVKTNLDAVVMLFMLIALTTITWSLVLVTQLSLVLFLVVTIGGPIACIMLYRTAVASYVAFAELLRSSVDLYRFDLLTTLHLPLPDGPTEEKLTWRRLREQAEFGDTAELRYKHPDGATG